MADSSWLIWAQMSPGMLPAGPGPAARSSPHAGFTGQLDRSQAGKEAAAFYMRPLNAAQEQGLRAGEEVQE